jgi:glycosyltransferase involved in cell wall biosynthesis
MARLRVSIAMTTFNGGPFVAPQLESFVAQHRRPDQLVVCDDGSSDGTDAVVESFAARAPFDVRFERNPTRLETTPNFEKAVSLCDGDIVFFSDQDDVWMPDKIETVVSLFQEHPETGAIFSNGRVVDEELRQLGYDLWDSLWFDAAERSKVHSGRAVEVFVKHVVAAGTTLAFRGLYRELILPFPDLHDCHDAWVSFLITAVSGVRIVDRTLIDYRLHGANQFGLRKFNLAEQLEKARWQLAERIFEHNVRFFGAVRERLRAQSDPRFQAPAATLSLVEGKIEHAGRRDAMSPALLRRLPTIVGETLRGNYWRYSYGIKSVAQDILLR